MFRPLGVAVLATLTLSACTPVDTLIEHLISPVTAVARTAVGLAEAPPVPRRKPEATPEPTRADADPQRLVGLDFNGTKALLGDPAAMLEQPPAKVWAYAGGGCMFNVFFYPSVADQGFRVLAYEVTDEADVLGLRWLRDPPVAAPEAPRVLGKDDSFARRCFAELLDHQESNAG